MFLPFNCIIPHLRKSVVPEENVAFELEILGLDPDSNI